MENVIVRSDLVTISLDFDINVAVEINGQRFAVPISSEFFQDHLGARNMQTSEFPSLVPDAEDIFRDIIVKKLIAGVQPNMLRINSSDFQRG